MERLCHHKECTILLDPLNKMVTIRLVGRLMTTSWLISMDKCLSKMKMEFCQANLLGSIKVMKTVTPMQRRIPNRLRDLSQHKSKNKRIWIRELLNLTLLLDGYQIQLSLLISVNLLSISMERVILNLLLEEISTVNIC